MKTALTVLVYILVFSSTFAQIPETISYQGYLEGNGQPMSGTVDLGLKIFDAASGPEFLWQDTQNGVVVRDGVFSVQLGPGGAPPLSQIAFDRPLWLGISVNGVIQTPRAPLASTPYALSMRGLRVLPTGDGTAPNMVGGHPANQAGETVVGATISGGGYADETYIWSNSVEADYGTIGGGRNNTVSELAATVGGGITNAATGDRATIGGGANNTASGSFSTVGGGWVNGVSGSLSAVGGGNGNRASGDYSTVGGGVGNTAGGVFATVPGGFYNLAVDLSLAAGSYARARHKGTFVWNGRSVGDVQDSLSTTADNQFLIHAAGGVGIGTNAPTADVHIAGDSDGARPLLFLQETGTGDYARFRLQNSDASADYWDIAAGASNTERLNFFTRSANVVTFWPDDNAGTTYPYLISTSAGTARLTQGGVWSNASGQDQKTDFRDIDVRGIVETVANLELQEWRYRVEPNSVRHIGPTAEEFFEALGLGDSDESIGTVDADGIALAAIQGLYELVKDQQGQIEALQDELKQMKASVPKK